jgi:Holliday junction resolvase RusA-like endonuclease
MSEYFQNFNLVNNLVKELGLTHNDIKRIHESRVRYANIDQIFAIPIMLDMEPRPYQPIRINRYTMRIYVPNKEKLVKQIREEISKQINPALFKSGFFPRYNEIAIRSELYIKTPNSFSREDKYLAEIKQYRPVCAPDIDNVEKIIFDSVKGYITYDDAQIVTNVTEKYYSVHPRMEVVVFYNASEVTNRQQKVLNQRRERWNSNH